MVKKVGAKNKIIPRKIQTVVKKAITPPTKNQTEKILIDNFIALQKVNTDLAIKFDKLTNQISSLLELFEVSAKTLAEKNIDTQKENRDNKQIIEKVDNLLEQNKTIARGVALIHEVNPGHTQMLPSQRIMQNPRPTQNTGKYQPSTSPRNPQPMETKRD